jgi:N-acetylglucosaminyldiphosphoundecaprenol N-acetyl-beta-D-mannosaminyltransferase
LEASQIIAVKMFRDGLTPQETCENMGAALSGNESLTLPERDDLARPVYGLFGMPIDAVARRQALEIVLAAARGGRPFLISTPNVNFMAACQVDREFRESLLQSDLCLADGMPIVWLAKLLGIPLKERVSGSDLFDVMKSRRGSSRPISVFLFGGAEGLATRLGEILNSQSIGMRCIGSINPGYGTVDDLSEERIIKTLNGSGADFLAVFLSAKKAQSWLIKNHDRLHIPVRGQFGATINYQAGTVIRAPVFIQRLGFEWLWRIKEEPYLWRRYLSDGLSLIWLVASRALPIVALHMFHRAFSTTEESELRIETYQTQESAAYCLVGHAQMHSVMQATACFRKALADNRNVVIECSRLRSIDPRFLGLLLMFQKQLKANGRHLKFEGASRRVRRMFRLYGFEFLLGETE